mgnify:CR=1 FL=1
MAKTKSDILEKDTKTKSSTKKTKVKDEPLEPKVSQPEAAETLDDVKVDVEIDLRSYNHSDVVGGYIRRKRLI